MGQIIWKQMGQVAKKISKIKYLFAKKEAQETKHWLRMIAVHNPERKEQIKLLWNENQELTLIFQKITNSLRNNV